MVCAGVSVRNVWPDPPFCVRPVNDRPSGHVHRPPAPRHPTRLGGLHQPSAETRQKMASSTLGVPQQ